MYEQQVQQDFGVPAFYRPPQPPFAPQPIGFQRQPFADPAAYSPEYAQYLGRRGVNGIGATDTGVGVATIIWSALSLGGAVSGAYHGYRRNNSVGWAIGWAILGGLFPVITIPVSLAQGFGQPKARTS